VLITLLTAATSPTTRDMARVTTSGVLIRFLLFFSRYCSRGDSSPFSSHATAGDWTRFAWIPPSATDGVTDRTRHARHFSFTLFPKPAPGGTSRGWQLDSQDHLVHSAVPVVDLARYAGCGRGHGAAAGGPGSWAGCSAPYQTLRVVDALIAADKDFDLLIVPGEQHGSCTAHHYVTRRVWDYLVRHLLGAEPPEYSLQPFPVDLEELLG
jgi:hypothetical protein